MTDKKSIFIKSIQDGFRRCGIAHPAEWVEHPAGTFNDEQIERLKKEPKLVVSDTAGNDIKDEALNKREAELDEREKELDEREKALKDKKKSKD